MECDRPLWKKDYRSETTGYGKRLRTTYYCIVCNSEARISASMVVWVGCVLWACVLAAMAVGIIIIPNDTDRETVLPYVCLFGLAPLAFFGVGAGGQVQVQTHLRPLAHSARH